MAFYITTPIYYVNAAAAPRPRLHDDRRRRARPAHRRQRGEDVFFLTGTDEHGEPVADAAHALGIDAAGARRPQRRALRGADAAARRRPTTSSSAPPTRARAPRRRRCSQRVHDNGYIYKGTYEGWYCPRCADFKVENEIARGQPLPDPRDRADARAGGELLLPAVGLPGAARARSTPSTPDFVVPAHRFNEARSFIGSGPRGRLAHAAQADAGACGARGIPSTSSTSGSTRCSTTTRRSGLRARPART